MNIDNMTYGELKKIAAMFSTTSNSTEGLNCMIGEKVIVRTYSAGVWFGKLAQKSGNEVILEDARRMWKWWAAESISLSGVALYGIKEKESRIAPPVPTQWLEAIEITPCSAKAVASLEGAEHAKAQ